MLFRSAETLNRMFKSPKPFIEFVLDEILSLYDLSNPKARESGMHEGIGYIKTLSAILQDKYKDYFAQRLGINQIGRASCRERV